MRIKTKSYISSFFFLFFFVSCNSINLVKETKKVTEDKSWNIHDSEIITDSLVNRILSSTWGEKIAKKQKPKIIIGRIDNLAKETINTELLEKNIERSFLNSGVVTFIPSKSRREEIRSDRKRKNDFKSKKKLKKYLKPLKSNFFIDGEFKMITDSLNGKVNKSYKLSVEIINSKSLKRVYEDSFKIRK